MQSDVNVFVEVHVDQDIYLKVAVLIVVLSQ